MTTLDLNLGSTVKVGTMTTTDAPHHPNHHAHHPGFSGIGGALAALTMTVGRDGDARLAAELTDLRPDDRLVDLGCGPGAAARHAARLGASVTGVDPAPVMLDVARKLSRRRSGIAYLEGAAEAIPLPDGSATVVWALATVHHWPTLEPALVEVARVLAPGGRFLAAERRTRPNATGLASHGWTSEQAATFASLCRDAGFVDVAIATHPGRRSLVTVMARRP
jgi:ubiquinone/menaquinone biosynthesis C-methylase UbiE